MNEKEPEITDEEWELLRLLDEDRNIPPLPSDFEDNLLAKLRLPQPVPLPATDNDSETTDEERELLQLLEEDGDIPPLTPDFENNMLALLGIPSKKPRFDEAGRITEELWHTYWREIDRYCITRLGNTIERVETVIEVFVDVWHALISDDFKIDQFTRTRLFAITKKRCDQILEKDEGYQKIRAIELEKEKKLAFSQARRRWLVNSLEKLSPADRRIVIWRYLQGMETRDIANLMKESETVIRGRLHSTLRRLRDFKEY